MDLDELEYMLSEAGTPDTDEGVPSSPHKSKDVPLDTTVVDLRYVSLFGCILRVGG
jgi:hypothetical protein